MRGEAWGSKEMLCAMCTLISGAASKAIRKRARAAAYAPDKGCCPVTSSGAISDVIKCNQRRHQGAARCDQADDLSEGLESARSTARSPEGIETRLHAVCHYGSCDACDGPGVELRGRPRVGLGVAEPCLRTVDSHAGQAGASAWSSLFRGGTRTRGGTPRLIAPSRLVICRAPRRGQPGGGPRSRGACRRARVSFMLSVCYSYPATEYTFLGTAAVAARHGRPSGPDWTLRTRPPSVPGATRASSPAPGPCSTLSRLTSAMHVALISPFCREGAAKGVLHPASPRPPHASTTLSMRRVLPRRTAIAASTPAASSPPVLPPSIPSSSWPSCMLARLR